MPLYLGKRPPKKDKRTLRMVNYLEAVTPPPPAMDWQDGVPQWPLYGNDRVGDCTVASAGHLIGGWTWNAARNEALFTDEEIIAAYAKVSGYNPKTGSNDRGAVMLDVLNYWRQQGVGGRKILAYVALDVNDENQFKQAINTFGGVYAGLELPLSAQSTTGRGVWDATVGPKGEPGSWGGHAVCVSAYQPSFATCITWGKRQPMTWRFIDKYLSEAYAIVSLDFLLDNRSPNGFDLVTLQRDLVALGAKDPFPPPVSPTPPPPIPTPSSGGLDIHIEDKKVIDKVTKAAQYAGQSVDEFVTNRLRNVRATKPK